MQRHFITIAMEQQDLKEFLLIELNNKQNGKCTK